jgi:uncharacterized protein (DUF1330 family)
MERLIRSAGTESAGTEPAGTEPAGGPPGGTGTVVMLNLLRYREVADYSATPELDPGTPCSGREAYGRYSEAVLPLLAALGGGIEMFGPCHATLIGPEDEEWDDIVLARYPGVAAFVGMVTSPEYRAIAGHRTAALADSRLVPTGAIRP